MLKMFEKNSTKYDTTKVNDELNKILLTLAAKFIFVRLNKLATK